MIDRTTAISSALRFIIEDLERTCRDWRALRENPLPSDILLKALEYVEFGEYGLAFDEVIILLRKDEIGVGGEAAYKLARVAILMRTVFDDEYWKDADPEFANIE